MKILLYCFFLSVSIFIVSLLTPASLGLKSLFAAVAIILGIVVNIAEKRKKSKTSVLDLSGTAPDKISGRKLFS